MFKAYRTHEVDGKFKSEIVLLDDEKLSEGEVIIKVAFSGINYKDYLSSQGNKGVTKQYPHTPGIDAAGVVVKDRTQTFQPGEEVVVMGYDLGMNTDGGFAEYIAVPAAWVLRKPGRFTLKETMQIGTSGFTAGLGISKILQMGAQPEDGPIVVSGATGGVGVYAVQMLSKLGFEVWAVTGKKDAVSLLSDLGAAKVIGREDIMAPHEKPLLRPRWAGAFDTVGGETLVSLLKQCQKSGSVATCGNVGGLKLEMTVLPFILNGINLLGINAADTPMKEREQVWTLLEQIADPELTAKTGKEISLEEVSDALASMGNQQHTGRFLIQI
ncbi:MAG: YhdH/YhfP family quinone oxidoreductase [Bacteroidales bacterium]